MKLTDLINSTGNQVLDSLLLIVAAMAGLGIVGASLDKTLPSYVQDFTLKLITSFSKGAGTSSGRRRISRYLRTNVLNLKCIFLYSALMTALNVFIDDNSGVSKANMLISSTATFFMYFLSALITRFSFSLLFDAFTVLRATIIIPLSIIVSIMSAWLFGAASGSLQLATSTVKDSVSLPVGTSIEHNRLSNVDYYLFRVNPANKRNEMSLVPAGVFMLSSDPCGKTIKSASQDAFGRWGDTISVEDDSIVSCWSGSPDSNIVMSELTVKLKTPRLAIWLEAGSPDSAFTNDKYSASLNSELRYVDGLNRGDPIFDMLTKVGDFVRKTDFAEKIKLDPSHRTVAVRKFAFLGAAYLLPSVSLLMFFLFCFLAWTVDRHASLETKVRIEQNIFASMFIYIAFVYAICELLRMLAGWTQSSFYVVRDIT